MDIQEQNNTALSTTAQPDAAKFETVQPEATASYSSLSAIFKNKWMWSRWIVLITFCIFIFCLMVSEDDIFNTLLEDYNVGYIFILHFIVDLILNKVVFYQGKYNAEQRIKINAIVGNVFNLLIFFIFLIYYF